MGKFNFVGYAIRDEIVMAFNITGYAIWVKCVCCDFQFHRVWFMR